MSNSDIGYVIVETHSGEFVCGGHFWDHTPNIVSAKIHNKVQYANTLCKKLNGVIEKINAKYEAAVSEGANVFSATGGWGKRDEKFEVRTVTVSLN